MAKIFDYIKMRKERNSAVNKADALQDKYVSLLEEKVKFNDDAFRYRESALNYKEKWIDEKHKTFELEIENRSLKRRVPKKRTTKVKEN